MDPASTTNSSLYRTRRLPPPPPANLPILSTPRNIQNPQVNLPTVRIQPAQSIDNSSEISSNEFVAEGFIGSEVSEQSFTQSIASNSSDPLNPAFGSEQPEAINIEIITEQLDQLLSDQPGCPTIFDKINAQFKEIDIDRFVFDHFSSQTSQIQKQLDAHDTRALESLKQTTQSQALQLQHRVKNLEQSYYQLCDKYESTQKPSSMIEQKQLQSEFTQFRPMVNSPQVGVQSIPVPPPPRSTEVQQAQLPPQNAVSQQTQDCAHSGPSPFADPLLIAANPVKQAVAQTSHQYHQLPPPPLKPNWSDEKQLEQLAGTNRASMRSLDSSTTNPNAQLHETTDGMNNSATLGQVERKQKADNQWPTLPPPPQFSPSNS